MNRTPDVLDRLTLLSGPPELGFEDLLRSRKKRERARKMGVITLVTAIAVTLVAVGFGTFDTWLVPADTQPKPPGIFSEVGGWIAYGNQRGIWAVDPSHPGDRGSQIQLSSSNPGTPLAWSSDGSNLLVSAPRLGLFVLRADGTEIRLVRDAVSGASFSPDGTTVVFAPSYSLAHPNPGIYLIDADGGEPRLLLAPSRRYFPEEDRSFRTGLSLPTFSPDGTQIAYIDGLGDWGNSLRVMNADGSDVRVLDGSDVHVLETGEAASGCGTGSVACLGMHPNGLSWSPDGTRLAVGLLHPGIYVVDADGSGLTLTIPDGANPYWSPDGTRISYQLHPRRVDEPLRLAAADGTGGAEFGYAASGPWNPLVQPEPEVTEVSAEGGRLTLTWTLLPLAALMILVVGMLVIRRRMAHRARDQRHQ